LSSFHTRRTAAQQITTITYHYHRETERERDGETERQRVFVVVVAKKKKTTTTGFERERSDARETKRTVSFGETLYNEQQRYKNKAEKRIRNAVDVYHALGVDFGATHIRAHAHFGESFFETYSVVCVLYAEIGDSVAVLVLLWTDGKTDANERYFLEATLLVRTDGDFFRDRVLTRVRV